MFKNKQIVLSLLIAVLMVGFFAWLVFINSKPQVDFNPQHVQKINITDKENSPVSVLATILPQFILKLKDQKYKNMFEANAAEKNIKAEVVDFKDKNAFSIKTNINIKTKEAAFTPLVENSLKPGLYRLNVKIKTYTGEDITIEQDFTWGVMAINTSKAVYKIGEQVLFQMAVLDEFGKTKCIAKDKDLVFGTAKVKLTIVSPTGKTQDLSTDDGSIFGSKSCADRSVTNSGDFLANYTPQEKGKYIVHMKAETLMGIKNMDYSFIVNNALSVYDIERTAFPTRIYPFSNYPIEITVNANQDYEGDVYDIIPKELTITDVSNFGRVIKYKDYQIVNWHVKWNKGQTYLLNYIMHFPRIVPEFYLIGPLKIDKFSEGKEWQIVSDSLFQLIQESHATGTGTTIYADLPHDPATNNLVIVNCFRTSSGSFTTPTSTSSGTFSSAYNNSSGSPRVYQYYKVAPAGQTRHINCRVTTSTTMGVQVLEFSGNSTSGVRDAVTTTNRRNSHACTTSDSTTAGTGPTPANPDELAIAVFAGTGTTTANSHTGVSGTFADSATSFSPGTGTFDSAWSELVNNPPVPGADTVNYAASATTCANVLVFYNPTVSVSMGSFRFFYNANSIFPGDPMAATNSGVQLAYPNEPFRVRFLIDIDSASGTILGSSAANFTLEYATLSSVLTTPWGANLSCVYISTASGYSNNWDFVTTPDKGGDIAFNTNPDACSPYNGYCGNGAWISAIAGDPNDTGYTRLPQSYYQDDVNGDQGGVIANDQSAIANNQAGLWDVSLFDNTDNSVTRSYCLRVSNGGTLLNAYRSIAKVTTEQTDVVIRGSPGASGTLIRGSTGGTGGTCSGTCVR